MDWFDVIQSVISGIFVGLVVFGLDMIRAKRERRLSDFRIASNWEVTQPKPSLRNFDLKGTNLSGYDLSSANLESANLQKTALWGTNLNGANLRKVNFRSANLVGVNFANVVSFYSDYSGVLIKKRSESGKNYIPNFTNANFWGTVFKNATIKNAMFNNVVFNKADFSGATIEDCDFSDSDLTDSKWLKVRKVENCIWKNVKIGDTKSFPKWLLEEIQMQNTKPNKKKQNGK